MAFGRFVAAPENQAGLVAVQDLAVAMVSGKTQRVANPLLLHGPSGCGKTHLLSALVEEVVRHKPTLTLDQLPAADLVPVRSSPDPQRFPLADSIDDPADPLETVRHLDLLLVEDLQHLVPAMVERFVQLMDWRAVRNLPTVLTASAGPRHLNFRGEAYSARLTSRLAAGLVVALEPLGPASRLELLQEKAQRRQLAVTREVLTWLANHLSGGGRQLEGALLQLEMLVRQQPGLLDVDSVASHFREQAEAGRPTVERIAQHVGGYFQVNPGQLQSRRRHRNILWPRQVGMYLARRLTELSLEQIGTYFGGRDHSTVLHACRKVEKALAEDAELSGVVRQIHAQLA